MYTSKDYSKKWREKHREQAKAYFKKYYQDNKEKVNLRCKKYKIKHKQKILLYGKKYGKRYRQYIRLLCIQHYGNKCTCCGESRVEFLSIDHINGGGSAHRRSVGSIFHWLIKNKFPEGFRVLCHNCNMSKAFYGYCPHNRDTDVK